MTAHSIPLFTKCCRVPVDDPPRSTSDDASSGQPVAGEPEAALAQTLARLKEEQAKAAEDAKTRERQLEETLENAQKARCYEFRGWVNGCLLYTSPSPRD